MNSDKYYDETVSFEIPDLILLHNTFAKRFVIYCSVLKMYSCVAVIVMIYSCTQFQNKKAYPLTNVFFPKTSAFHLLMLSFNNSYFQFTDALLQTQAYQIQMFSQYRCFPIKDAIQMLVFLKDYRHMIDCTRTMNRGFEI